MKIGKKEIAKKRFKLKKKWTEHLKTKKKFFFEIHLLKSVDSIKIFSTQNLSQKRYKIRTKTILESKKYFFGSRKIYCLF